MECEGLVVKLMNFWSKCSQWLKGDENSTAPQIFFAKENDAYCVELVNEMNATYRSESHLTVSCRPRNEQDRMIFLHADI
ncbi:unnamed protein product [Onchocerca ochengi]|uniref:Ovule protein n=1 Tax=Onchocerca ochengi TaxID=42157 RepID=A0A182ECN9_ONCOC|nr:unnamed protein product [Onchocerca ochengi]